MAGDAGFGVVPIELARTLDGLDLFKGLLDGKYPAPPITKALGFSLLEVEEGRVVSSATRRCSTITTRWARCMAASPPPCSIR